MGHKNRFNNKKGQAQYLLENAFRIGFLMIALVAFFLLINFYIVNKFDTNKLQSEVIANRIMYSDTFMYQENSRTYTGIVDMTKFTDTTINNNIDYPNKKHVAVKMRLVNNNDPTIEHIAYLNKAQYDILYAIKKSGADGKGSATAYYKQYPVTYIDLDGKYYYGTIYMNIVVPNS
ncbi:MAG: hypothetical protein ACP5N1_06715 [Candidatus Woesearchaeota archaeon]